MEGSEKGFSAGSAGGDRSIADHGGLIAARGTGEGLVIRLDGRADRISLKEALRSFMLSREDFLAGQEVLLEWVGARPEDAFSEEISSILHSEFGIRVKSYRVKESKRVDQVHDVELRGGAAIRHGDSRGGDNATSEGLFGGVGALGLSGGVYEGDSVGMKRIVEEKTGLNQDSLLWDEPDARIVYATLRSGQRIETEHSLVVFGDINSGAELVAGGDIIVMGSLRGVAHAGAYDETGGGRFIFALNLQPTQLRIGMVISRGGTEGGSKSPEIARVDGNIIVVEPYAPKSILSRRR